jgi:hypothetical protein
LSVAEHTITACYAGGGAFNPQNGQVAHTVNKAATSLALTKSPVANTVFGQTVVFTAKVSVTAPGAGTLVGDVKFYEFAAGGTCAAPNGTLLDTKTLASAEAQFSSSTLSATAHTIDACYQGSTNFAGSGNSVSHTVEKALTSTVVTSSSPSNTSTYGDEVTFEATVSVVAPGGGTPTGNVKFIEGGTCATPTTTHASEVALSGGKASFNISNLGAGPHDITACYVESDNYLASIDDVEQTVNKAPLTITAEYKEKFYGDGTPAFTVKNEGLVLGEGASVLGGTLAFTLKDADGNTVTPAASNPAGTYTITPGGQTSNNYQISFEDGKLTIKPAPLKITADDAEKFYGGAVPAFTASYDGFVLGETSSVLSGTLIFTVTDAANNIIAPSTSDPAGDYTITPSGLSSNNYAITFVAGKLTVKPAPLTITAENKDQFFGEPALTFTVTYSGFVLGQNQSVLGGTLTFTFSGGITPGTTTPVGVYDIIPGGLTSTNYAVTFQKGTYTVKEWSITGFYAPVDVPAGGTMWNMVKGGSTVPLKFEVFAGVRELTDPGSTVKPQPNGFIAQGVQCPNNGLTDNIEFTTTGGTVLRYDATAGQFIQNWQTPKKPGTCYKTTMMTQDGSSIYAYFILK